jgi:uncharacterized protein DUF5916/cellulose/xylan binding protein with CBM9 domain
VQQPAGPEAYASAQNKPFRRIGHLIRNHPSASAPILAPTQRPPVPISIQSVGNLSRRIVSATTLTLGLAIPALTRAQAPESGASFGDVTSVVATHADRAPAIDGHDDDPVWRSAPRVTGFRQFDPVENGDPRFRTEFRVAYDSRNIYVFVRAFDPEPALIRQTLARRDVRPPSDQLKVMIDSYHDGRTGFEFAVSPGRVKRDFAMYNDTNEDGTWDGVWDVATSIDSLGWTAEFAIPMSQLGFTNAPVHTIGFGVWRDIDRFKERVSWPLFRISRNATVSQLGTVTGIGDVGSGHPLEVVPYVVTKNVSTVGASSFGRTERVSAGADLKLGLTPGLRLAAAVNPDFGQVEADPSVLNLGAFETFFSEQRPFFVEGQGRYTVNINCSVVNCSSEGLFYSRRIGRTPQLLGAYGVANSSEATTILGAAKLSGHIGKSLSVGVLDAVTGRAAGSLDRTIEPATNYGVARLQREFRGGASNIGIVATSVERATDSWTSDALRRTATVGGVDFSHHFLANNNYQVSGSLTASNVTGTPSAITRTQMNAVHYYQRPDGQLHVDSGLTSLTGNAQEFLVGKYGGGITRFETSYERQSAGYEINDIGYLRRADQQSWSNWGALNFFTPTRLYNSLRFNGNFWNQWTTDGLALEHAVNTNVHMILPNNWGIHTGLTLGQLGSTYCDRCARGGPAVRQSSYLAPWLSIGGDDRRRITPSLSLNASRGDDGRTHSLSVAPSVAVRASAQLLFSLDVEATSNEDNGQWIGNFNDPATSATHYAFAHLHQKTLMTAIRATYIATPELSLQFYAQPFVSNGSYSDARQLSANPRAARYDERYVAYAPPASAMTGFSDREFKSNTVVRWEYRPGSTLFFVWTQGRQRYDDSPDTRSWTGTYPDLMKIRPDNTFLVKLSYWLNR